VAISYLRVELKVWTYEWVRIILEQEFSSVQSDDRKTQTFAMISLMSFWKKMFPCGDLNCSVGTPDSVRRCSCIFRSSFNEGTSRTSDLLRTHRNIFMSASETRSRGKLSSASSRNIWDGRLVGRGQAHQEANVQSLMGTGTTRDLPESRRMCSCWLETVASHHRH